MIKSPSDYEYQIGGSLSAQASSYVTRKADLEFYENLKAGEFCYVLNSRQMGKSSLRVRTMESLQADGIVCAFIDLTGIGKEDVTAEKWYAGIIQSLVSSCQLNNKINWRKWWKERRDLLSPVQRLNLFIDEILLVEVEEQIIIFVDEIDRVLSQSFSLDDFFALIRFFYNKRADNRAYKRLTFALLGVATPSDLIKDKTQTPFNIGKPIELQGFKLDEVEPLVKGLRGKVDNPQLAIREILHWTGGQPFLTQKLCKIIKDYAYQDYAQQDYLFSSKSISDIVQKHIIDNWENQDEPEHLKTIRDRILRNENKAGRLLGIYQESLQQQEVTADGSLEQTDLRLSGLVVQNQGRLKVYNSIYQNIFNHDWVEKQLANLRPYSQNFNVWVDSNFQDESRLLQGQALQDALSWANNQQLSPNDYRFLSASQELEQRQIQINLDIKEEESKILAQANDTLTQAQKKAKKTITFGSIFFIISLVTALFTGLELIKASRERTEANLSFKSAAIENTINEQPFNALREGLIIANKIKDLAKPIPIQKETRTQIKKTLSQSISLVREQNRIEVENSLLTDVTVSPIGKFIATGGTDSIVRIWDIKGNLIHTLKGHSDEIWNVRFSPDGKTLASCSRDGTIKFWNVENGRFLKTILAHNNTWVRSISFSPDGKIIASSSSRGWVKLWNVADGKLIQEIPAHRKPVRWVTYVKFSPDGKTLASASGDNTIKLWHVEDGKLLKTLKGHKSGVRTVDFSPDGKILASTSEDSTVKLWNLENGDEIENFPDHRGLVWGVNFSPDGKQLVSSGSDGTLRLWNLNTPDTRPQTFKGHTGGIRNVTFSPDGKKLFSIGDRTLRIWSLEDTEPQTLLTNDGEVSAVSFSPDGKIIAAAGTDSNIKLWNIKNRKLIKTLKGHTKNIIDISFSPNGKLLVSGSSDKTVKLWNLENGTEIYSRKGHTGIVYSVNFSPDGKQLASASNDRTVKIWNAEDGELLQTLQGHVHTARAVSFSPDGKKFASASSDGRVIFWNINNGRMSGVFDTGMGYLHALAFSPDSKLIATGGDQGVIKIWDTENEKELQPITAHREWIRSLSFSPNGKILASGSFDNTIKLWNLKDGQLLRVMEGHLNKITQISFSPDGKTIASASRDGTVKLWKLDLKLDDLMKMGCGWLGDYLAIHPEQNELQEVCNQQNKIN
ncbi:AAA-like domain-containing protein [Mastigocoleus sp. MO_188.B34]|uniref:WD40 domain-containing protein n=1 Tax=Mastigocoleus sp. MO_188.B34 TaxID=3036635 RepID=UPI00261E8F4E|nr:AAA-like domain-containing protein [Mastigocoleus sp. MO_188.B34]MDJ0697625.1 AAA-like domain-containing protein [Mastigocoleus sp. MO_188.B34]